MAELSEKEIRNLIRTATAQMSRAYAPYSHHYVGAALLCADGSVFAGCNIENAAYGPSNCAERTAVFKAVSEGERDFRAIAITGGMHGKPSAFCTPCGVCRQVLREFCDPETFLVITAVSETAYRIRTLAYYLPDSFGPENLT